MSIKDKEAARGGLTVRSASPSPVGAELGCCRMRGGAGRGDGLL